MTRLLIAEAPRSKDVALVLQRQGIGRGTGVLERWLAAEAALGTFKIDDLEDAASVLLFSAAGDYLPGLLFHWLRVSLTARSGCEAQKWRISVPDLSSRRSDGTRCHQPSKRLTHRLSPSSWPARAGAVKESAFFSASV